MSVTLYIPFASRHIARLNINNDNMSGKFIEFILELGVNSDNENYLMHKKSINGEIILYDELDPTERPEDYEVGDIGIQFNHSDFFDDDGSVKIYSNEELKHKKINKQYRASILIKDTDIDTNPINLPIDNVIVNYSAYSK